MLVVVLKVVVVAGSKKRLKFVRVLIPSKFSDNRLKLSIALKNLP